MLLFISQQICWLRCNFTQQFWQAQISEGIADPLIHNLHGLLLFESLFVVEGFLEELQVDLIVVWRFWQI
jgi:hypothetical protein